jgi:hypothetical protein
VETADASRVLYVKKYYIRAFTKALLFPNGQVVNWFLIGLDITENAVPH